MASDFQVSKALYTVIQKQFLGDRQFFEGEFFTMATPGIALRPDLDESNARHLQEQSNVLDRAFDSTFTYNPKVERISSIVRDVVENAYLPQKDLTPEQEEEIVELESFVDDGTDSYEEYKWRYLSAKYERIAAVEEGGTTLEENLARARERRALREWEDRRKGNRRSYERKISRLNQLTSRDPNTAWDRWRERFEASSMEAGGEEFWPVSLIPAVSRWSDGGTSWGRFAYSFDSNSFSSYSKSTSWSGGGGISLGLWSFGGGASGSEERRKMKSDASGITVEFDYLRVNLSLRGWLNESFLRRRNWAFDPATYGNSEENALSYGSDPAAFKRPLGRLPVLPLGLLVVKNVKLSGFDSSEEREFIQRTLTTRASVGWGPFRVSGSYSSTTTSEKIESEFQDGSIVVKDAQIVGVFGSLMPDSPNPDLTLNWETPPVLAGPSPALVDVIREVRGADDVHSNLTFAEEEGAERISALTEEHAESIDRLAGDFEARATARGRF